MARRAWLLVSEKTIANCFRHAGFLVAEASDDVEVLADLEPELQLGDDLTGVEENIPCSGELTDGEIIANVTQLDEVDDDEEEAADADADALALSPSATDALNALGVLKAYFESKGGDMNSLDEIEDKMWHLRAKSSVQTTLD